MPWHNLNSLIAPQNYTFQLMGKDAIGSAECLVVRALPRRKERDLFQGNIGVDDHTFAVLKIAGDLAKSPSFCVKQVHFVREYRRIGEFWLPSREQAVSLVRIFGRETLPVEYYEYAINGARHDSKFEGRSAPGATQTDSWSVHIVGWLRTDVLAWWLARRPRAFAILAWTRISHFSGDRASLS